MREMASSSTQISASVRAQAEAEGCMYVELFDHLSGHGRYGCRDIGRSVAIARRQGQHAKLRRQKECAEDRVGS